MGPEVSSPCSQELSTSPNPEINLVHITDHISLISNLTLSTHLHLDLPSGLFSSGFPSIIYSLIDFILGMNFLVFMWNYLFLIIVLVVLWRL
jgi:hypothetical protein